MLGLDDATANQVANFKEVLKAEEENRRGVKSTTPNKAGQLTAENNRFGVGRSPALNEMIRSRQVAEKTEVHTKVVATETRESNDKLSATLEVLTEIADKDSIGNAG